MTGASNIDQVFIVKVSSKWEVQIDDSDHTSPLTAYEVECTTNTVNSVGGFKEKRLAQRWAKQGFPVTGKDKKRGVSHIVWARNWKQACKLATMELAEVIDFEDVPLARMFLLNLKTTELLYQGNRAGLVVKHKNKADVINCLLAQIKEIFSRENQCST